MADLGKRIAKNSNNVATADYKNNITVSKDRKDRKTSKSKSKDDNDSSKSIHNRKTMQSKIEACFKTFLKVGLKI